MNLTQLASTICLQTGMNDTDDQAAALTFLQTRLMMIWNSQLWKDSLIEANFTINPDGTSTLGNTIWIPGRSTLMLPPEFDNVLAVRTDGHTLRVASLESYYRQDMDWLNQNGDPTQFNVLRPGIWEFATPTPIFALCQNVPDQNIPLSLTYSPDGIQQIVASVNPFIPATAAPPYLAPFSPSALPVPSLPAIVTGPNITVFNPNPLGSALVIFNASQAASTASMAIGQPGALGWLTINGTGTSLDRYYSITGTINGKNSYTGIQQIALWTVPSHQSGPATPTLDSGNQYSIFWDGGQWVIYGPDPATSVVGNIFTNPDAVATPDLCAQSHWVVVTTAGVGQIGVASSAIYLPASLIATGPGAGAVPVRQRIRLVTNPQVSVNLRVLGKGACPLLGPYDLMPLNNVEPALMAFARGDMLLRQRQNGKAQIAAQEGASLLAALARSEVFQQAANNRIIPDGGFGEGSMHFGGDSFHPL